MNYLNLSKRLRAVVELVPEGGVADVGTDHGYIPVWLLQNGYAGHISATDIHAAPLERARQTAYHYNAADKISFYLCNGLDAVDSKLVAAVVIAGMGGETITAILKNAPWTRAKCLVLQPMSKAERLRVWLFENGYRVQSERLVRDSVIYEIITATGGTDTSLEPGEELTGRFCQISRDPLFPDRLRGLIDKTERAVAGLSESCDTDSAMRLETLKETLEGLRKMQFRVEN